MLGVIKNLIIIHLGSMRERIHPNRWINSERRDERLEGESAGHHLSAFASRSGLHFAEKLQEALEQGVLGLLLTAWLACQSWSNFMAFATEVHGMQATLLYQADRGSGWPGPPIHSRVVKTFFPLSSTFIKACTTATLYSSSSRELDDEVVYSIIITIINRWLL